VFFNKYGRVLERKNLSKPIKEIEGIGPTYAEKLANIGINTVHALLDKGCTQSGRKELAQKTSIPETLILEWVNMADLFRIEGIGEEYSDLLEEAGVDTVVELSKRVPENLHAKLKEVNEEKKLVKQLPSLDTVKKWIEKARTLPRKVEY
jgi:predicted flap endonuclease-1-like 5' DNA nuclease